MAEPSSMSEFGFDQPDDGWLAHFRTAHAATDGERPRLAEFELLGEAGRGGQAVVHRARDRRTGEIVALKQMLGGRLGSRSDLARFGREVRLARRLEHPGIVRIREVRVVDGSAVLVMEWVDGIDVATWARRTAGREVDRVLALGVRVAEAVHHAHQRGVLHRDLKPSNVLVTAEDQPKVLDFGIAKLLGGGDESPGGDRLTATDEFLGTLAYAAPEQLHRGARDLDVRSDVYGVGLLVYEMLTGTLPYDTGSSLAQTVHELERGALRPPSMHDPSLGREIDAVLGKALAGDPELRYPSMHALAEDLRRLRAKEPVAAHPPSTWYRLRKVVQRHRVVTALTVLAGTLAITLAVVTTVQAWRILESQRATRAARASADDTSAFLRVLLRDLGPAGHSQRATVEDIARRASERIDEFFPPSSPQRAELRDTVGTTLLELGHVALAVDVLRESVATRERLRGSARGDAKALVATQAKLADALTHASAFDEAETFYRRAIEGYRAAYGDDGQVAEYMQGLADLLMTRDRDREAIELLGEATEILRRVRGSEHPVYAAGIQALGSLHVHRGDYAAAESALREALAVDLRTLGPSHPETIEIMASLGDVARYRGKLDDAETQLTSALERCDDVLGPRHPTRGVVLSAMGAVRVRQGRLIESEECLREACDLLAAAEASDVKLATALTAHASVVLARHGPDRALEIQREAARLVRVRLGNDHLIAAMLDLNIAAMLAGRGARKLDRSTPKANDDLREAERLATAALAIQRRKRGPNHPDLAQGLNALATIAKFVRDWDRAETHYRQALTILQRALPGAHRKTLLVQINLAVLEWTRQRFGGAVPDWQVALQRFAAAEATAAALELPRNDPDLIWLLHDYAAVYRDAGRHAEAAAKFGAIAEAGELESGGSQRYLLSAVTELARHAIRTEATADAKRHLQRLRAIVRASDQPDPRYLHWVDQELAKLSGNSDG